MKNNKRIVICILLIVIMIGTLLVISNKPKKTFNYNWKFKYFLERRYCKGNC